MANGIYKFTEMFDIRTKSHRTIQQFRNSTGFIFAPVLEDNGKLGIGRYGLGEERGNTRVFYTVEFSNGASIKCSPDTEFRLYDSSYKRCEELTTDDKLFYTQFTSDPKDVDINIVSIIRKDINEIYMAKLEPSEGTGLIPLIPEGAKIDSVTDLIFICVKE